MNRLVRAPKSFIRALQISRVPINVFVEGDLDSYFYGQICRQELGGPFSYHVIRSDRLGTPGRGKTHMMKLFESFRRRGLLTLEFKGNKSAVIFFVDKDIDDLRRTKKRSPHLMYTQYYEVENYVFKHGKYLTAIGAACLMDVAEVESRFPWGQQWPVRAARLWADWLKLCLAAYLLKAPGVCNYHSPSTVNTGPMMTTDPAIFAAVKMRLRAVSACSPADFDRRFGYLVTRVDRLYRSGQQDVVFKGKWYKRLLSDELTVTGIASGASLRALPDRITGHLLQTLDFSEEWAHPFRSALRGIVVLTK